MFQPFVQRYGTIVDIRDALEQELTEALDYAVYDAENHVFIYAIVLVLVVVVSLVLIATIVR